MLSVNNLQYYFVFILVVNFLIASGQESFSDDPPRIQLIRIMKEFLLNFVGFSNAALATTVEAAREQQRTQDVFPENTPFPCNVSAGRSEKVPTSVHRLRPGDIDVIAAMGDSLTAGTGAFATNLLGLLVENRGVSVLGGGQATWRDVLTLPNILKEYNPKLIGYASEDSFSHRPVSRFNIGEIASTSTDLPYMAKILVKRMKNDPQVDIKNHWKFVGIFTGHNDICSDVCWAASAAVVSDNYKKNLIQTLRTLRDNLPRTLVCLVSMINLKLLTDMKDRSLICSVWAQIACPCLMILAFESRREQFLGIMNKWNDINKEVAAYPEFQREDFTVTVQTFTANITLPRKSNGQTDLRYSSADCFHSSQRMNAKMSLALWKNLFEPPNQKSGFTFSEAFDISCPTEQRPYFATLGSN